MTSERIEPWSIRDERGNTATAMVRVDEDDTVRVQYQLLSRLLTQAGYEYTGEPEYAI